MIGTQIKAYRRAMKLTQQEFGNLIGAHGTSVSGWERGENPRPRYRFKIKELLKEHSRQAERDISLYSDLLTPATPDQQTNEPQLYTIPENKFCGRIDGYYIFKK